MFEEWEVSTKRTSSRVDIIAPERKSVHLSEGIAHDKYGLVGLTTLAIIMKVHQVTMLMLHVATQWNQSSKSLKPYTVKWHQ